MIATPMSQLALVTMSVSKTKDYSIRAQKLSGDELGVLVDAFNEMLAGIQSRDSGLREALLSRLSLQGVSYANALATGKSFLEAIGAAQP